MNKRSRYINRDRQRSSFFACSLMLTVMMTPAASDTAWAENGAFRASCEKLVGTGKVAVVYVDTAATHDSSYSIKSLQSMSGKSNDGYHSIYGLTHAEPSLRYEVRSRWRVSPEGETCMVPDISLKLSFSAMRVYLARELQDNCRKNIVREHELEHVSAWKSHFRIGAKMLEDPLRAAFSQPRYYTSQTQAQADVKPWVEDVLKPLQQRLMDSVITAQRAIDSPASYGRVTQRLRACAGSGN